MSDNTVTTDTDPTGKEYHQVVAKRRGKTTALLIVAPVIVLSVMLFSGVFSRITRSNELKRVHEEVLAEVPTFTAVVAKPASTTSELLLPGNIQPIQTSAIYARAAGYVKEQLVDIGDTVKKGQVLAIIETPELDQQVEQAQADVRNAQAALSTALADRQQFESQLLTARATIKQWRTNLGFSTVQYNRYQKLSADGAVSFEARDQTLKAVESDKSSLEAAEQSEKAALSQVVAADSKVASAVHNIASSKSNLKRVEALRGFQKIIAPFDGVITNRLVDAGALIQTGASNTNTQLLAMARTDMLRIYIDVPQSVFKSVHLGDSAEVLVPEMKGKVFHGQVTNISGSINSDSRTNQTEIKIPNKDHLLTPGAYAQVRFTFGRMKAPLLLPGNAVVTKNDGLYVAVAQNGKVHYKKIEIERDFGNKAEIAAGVSDGDVCLIDPPDGLLEGDRVEAIVVDRDNAGPSNHPTHAK
ncbi:MAG: efflux RND transporter periplasmic adaptor subunit [Candidatus Melainabacteria bacterium]|nr:efflux RND transporter periplasmic adaptor subunit [Candidatus Melainabacteria bacterium]